MTLTLKIEHQKAENVLEFPVKKTEKQASPSVEQTGQQTVEPSEQARQCMRKADEEKQIVWGEVYVPNVPDSQGDFATAEEIEKMCYGFMAKGITDQINIEHDGKPCGAFAVECFIARKNDPDGFIEGSWVMGVHIPQPEIWEMVKSGELNGFSFEGMGFKKDALVKMSVPEHITGKTDLFKSDACEEHDHDFFVSYGPNGEFLGGYTSSAPDGHYHIIKKGTATEIANDHRHRFSFVEGVSAELVS